MSDSKIEWTDTTWNPTTGCDQVSPGCDHCYALTLAKRLKSMGAAKYQKDGDPKTSGPGFGVTEHPDVLAEPLKWKKPRRVFVNSMSDLFHKDISDGFIAQVFAIMAATPQHTYQVLTKRHGRMRSLLNDEEFKTTVGCHYVYGQHVPDNAPLPLRWPLPNVWLGVTVEDQKRADLRIPALLDTPAAVRFLSCEPLLGPVDLFGPVDRYGGRPRPTYWLTGGPAWGEPHTHPNGMVGRPLIHKPGVDWVIAGGESGSSARPAHPDWFRTLRNQCQRADVPFFFKQWGEYGPLPRVVPETGFYDMKTAGITVADDGTVYQPGDLAYPDGPRWGEALRAGHDRAHLTAMYRAGKKHTGRELDGRTWDEFPQATTAVAS